ncbi:MAG TPA: PIN domain-containing protein [Solirubrobacterales bacterium]
MEPIVAHSGLDLLDGKIDRVSETLGELLDLSGIQYHDINRGLSGVVVIANPYRWRPLPPDAAPKVGAARKALGELIDLSASCSRDAPDRLDELDKLAERLKAVVEQSDGYQGPPRSSLDQVRKMVDEAVAEYRSVVRRLPAAHGGEERVLVPDTSALLDRPDMQEWKLDGKPWIITFVPQVLSELDDRKRDPRTRDAAQKVINQIDEMDRRGDVFEGVPLAGKLRVREIAVSPDMNEMLSWLRPDVPDDVIIASALELTWENLARRIAVTASDRNVRNKARLAGLTTIRPRDL